MSSESNQPPTELTQALLALLADLAAEQKINAAKLKSAGPGNYPYGEGMHDGLRYAAEGLAAILRRHGLAE